MRFTLPAIALLAAATAVIVSANPPATQPASTYPLKTCIIGGEELGSMGEPVSETIDGREVRFCCAPCIKKFKEGGEESHKKLDAAIIEAQQDTYPLDTCLVAGEKLGDMGKPVVYVYRPSNQMMKFCCKGCVGQFEKKPDAYLDKLKKAYAAK